MSKPVIEGKKLSASEQALFAYLDEMLRAGTESAEAAIDTPVIDSPTIDSPSTEASVVSTLAETDAQPIENAIEAHVTRASVNTPEPSSASLLETPVEPALITLQDLAPKGMTAISEPTEEELQSTRLPPVKGWKDNGRPAWAQNRFDALIFKVAGLKLAVPLVSLGLIHPIDKKFNALPHQTPWFLGLLRVSGGASIKVIDTAMCVMPERYTPACREGLKYVITLHGYDWGLACHEVEKAICLDPDAINWRTQRGKRPWMAGTVRDHMCALIDSTGFHSVIEAVEPPKS